MLIAVISDTHIVAGNRRLPDACVELMASADLIVHAGDIVDEQALAEIEAIGPPVAAVMGNMDGPELSLPAHRTLDVGGATVAVVHDGGPPQGRLTRLRMRFPDADAAVFGHSHLPLHEVQDGFQIFNPGSPTERRRAPAHSMGLARVGESGLIAFEHVTL